jgi:uncharacterized protein (TIGR03067 family)
MIRRLPLFCALALCAGAAWAADAKDDAARKEAKALAGTWELVSMSKDGKEVPLPKEGKVHVTTAEDGAYTVKVGDMVVEKGTGKLDPTATPKAVDVTAADGPNKGQTVRGIYEVKGDEMRACFAAPGKDRPTDFTAKEGREVAVYKRVKP